MCNCNWENYIFDIAMAIAAVWIVKRFWSIFFEKKKDTVLSIGILAIYFVLQILFQSDIGNINGILSVINIIFILLIAMSGYECKGKSKIFLLASFWTVWALLEFLIVFMLNALNLNNENAYILGEVISKILMMIFVYILSLFWGAKREELIPNKFYLLLFFIPVGSIYIAICEFYVKADRISSMIIISILLVFNVIIYELYIKMNEIFIREKENTVYAQQLEIIAGNTVEQKRMMEEFHEEKHDLINELVVLKELIRKEKNIDAVKNIDEIINNCHSTEQISNTGNSTVDAVINFKYSVASADGIKFDLNIFIPEELPIEQKDIGVVLGNALDNAIEAVKSCKNKEKKIEISMGIKKEAWILVMKNPYENEIKKNRIGEIISNKEDQRRHGYGLKSIKRISDKYQGDVIIDMEDGVFLLTVILNLGGF